MRAQITLKSGAQIEVDVTELSTTRDKYSAELTHMEWATPDGWRRKLHTIAIDEIVAIVLIEEPEPIVLR